MRLISCHIENFGRLTDENITFSEGLNMTLKENGWGKSTLAAFIRAMFYGLEGDGKRDDIQCERKRFAPWQGGPFGGKLTFEMQGKKYEITRFFGSKAADDIFELRNADTNLLSTDYSNRIGEEIFLINSESFMRTVFIMQNDSYNASSTDDINAKLGNITDGIDLNRYASADGILKDALNAYSATRKTGEIAKLKARQSELKAIVQRGSGIENTIAEVESRIHDTKVSFAECKASLDSIVAKKNEAALLEKKLSDKRTLEGLLSEVDQKEKALNSRRRYFPGGVPTKEVCDSWEKACDDISRAEAASHTSAPNDSEREIYGELLRVFHGEYPDPAYNSHLANEANLLNKLRFSTKQFALSDDEKERFEDLSDLFGNVEEAEEEVNEAIEDWGRRNREIGEVERLEKELSDKEYAYGEVVSGGKGQLFFGIILLILSAGAFFTGKLILTTLYLPLTFAAGILLVLGTSFIVVSRIKAAAGNRERLVSKTDIDELRIRLDNLVSDVDSTEEFVEELLKLHGIPYEESLVSRGLQTILSKIYDYRGLIKKVDESKANDHTQECDDISKKINDYLLSYGIMASEEEYAAKLTDLSGKAAYFKSLKAKNDEHTKAKLLLEEKTIALRNELTRYNLDPGVDVTKKADEVIDIVTEYESLLSLYNDAKERLDAFSKTNNVVELMDVKAEEGVSFESLSEEENRLNARLEALRAGINTDTRTLDAYIENFENYREEKDELAAVTEAIEEKIKKLSYVSRAEEYLTKAKENLTAQYMEPLLTGFSKYYSLLTGESAETFRIDANTVITKEEKGRPRATNTLSFGYQDLIGFCMRLAMADAMYPDERPMLILDDPFVNLDDKKMEGAVKLLKNVAKDYQILYLTCREDRIG